MSDFKEEWLRSYAVVPVDIPTTGALLREVQRLRAYAVAQREALEAIVAASQRSMYERCPDCDSEVTCTAHKRCRVAPLDRCGEIAEAALAKEPAQPALGSLSSPQTGAQPERHETGPNTARPVPCAERNEMCWRRSCRALDTCVEREMREDDSRHQSGKKSQGVREARLMEALASCHSFEPHRVGECLACTVIAEHRNMKQPGEECVHQVGRYEPPNDAAVDAVIEAARATGMPLTALRWAIQRLSTKGEKS